MADDLKDIFNAAAVTPNPGEELKNDQKDIKDIFQAAHDSPSSEELSQASSEPEKPGLLARGSNFIQNLPTNVIDLVPGMKEKREQIEANRTSPEYQNSPSGIPNMTQGQEDQSFQQSNQAEQNDPGMAFLGATGPTSALDLAKLVPGLGSKVEALAPWLKNSGSKIAQEAMGMNSSKDLTSQFNPMTGQIERGSQIIKGTGTTALDQGVLNGSPGKWYDNALNALKGSYQKLGPIFSSVQAKIDPNVGQIMDQIGAITTKTPEVMQSVFDSVPNTSQRNVILSKIQQQYGDYEGKLAAADGNLQQLNQVKQELTTAAQNLKPQIYNNGSASAEADLYKRLGGVVRQHIEDLANVAQDGAGDQIHQVNDTIGRLSEMLPSLQKATRGGIPTDKMGLVQKVLGPGEAFVAKGLNTASKSVQTPIGDIIQKAVPQVARESVVQNPWQSAVNAMTGNTPGESPKDSSTHIAGSLYNATDDSLMNIANKLSKQPGMSYTSDYLKKAITDKDADAKNRAIFLIMQNSAARQLVSPGE
jgi:hypothetical protein